MLINLKKLLHFLSHGERKQLTLLLIMTLVMALLDTIGIASIMPFITVLANPDIIETNYILNGMFQALEIFGIKTKKEFLFVLAVLVFVLLVISTAFKLLTTYITARFVYMSEYSISKLLMEGYLNQPYSWFLNRNSADLGKSILAEVGTIVGSGLRPMIDLIAQCVLAITLLSLLILVDLKIALIVFSVFGSAYWLIYKLSRRFIKRIGNERFKSNELRFISISEAFGAFKEVKVSGLEEPYIKKFSDPAKKMAKHHVSFNVVSQFPRYALEAVAFGGMLLLILYLMSHNRSFSTIVPIISLYALAGYRLMPALQKIYTSFAQFRFAGPVIDNLYDDVKSLKLLNPKLQKNVLPLEFKKKITLNNVNFKYPNTSRSALKGISFDIIAKTTVGLVGTTGSGKTTSVDIILGLLEPKEGTLEVDGTIIDKQNLKAWQKTIGYVPQNIYLADDTISANIALGRENNNIDQKAVEIAAKIANLHEFVINELPKKYQTTVGERGVRLSGGQRQRIGIARALYHNPKVLILDEATSALDSLTEKAVMDAVHKLGKNITIILIAHRLSTIKSCDKIFLLEKGEIKNTGTFEELIRVDKNFQMNVNNQ